MDLPELFRKDTCDILIRTPLNAFPPTASIGECIRSLQKHNLSYCAIIDDNKELLGLVTEQDFLRLAGENKLDLSAPVKDIVVQYPIFGKSDDSIASIVLSLYQSGFRHIPIFDNKSKEVFGVVSVRDFVSHLIDYFPEAVYNVMPGQRLSTEDREGA
ncbi:MAG: CBS domain-containing protein [Candidatus Hodarchaeales archaeon]|jgi:CBS domain-containing protein